MPRKTLPISRLLVIAPHPDDEIICSGGLITRAAAEGAQVRVVYGSIGKSRQLVTGKTSEETRMKEAAAVAGKCGFTHSFLFVGDEFMRLDSLPQKSIIEKIEDEVQSFKPDAAVIPSGDSFDQDHRALHSACVTALRPLPRNLHHFVPLVLECEEPLEWGATSKATADYFVELAASQLEAKVAAMKLHKSQVREEPHARSLENLRRWAEFRGKEIGAHSAEAYRCRRATLL